MKSIDLRGKSSQEALKLTEVCLKKLVNDLFLSVDERSNQKPGSQPNDHHVIKIVNASSSAHRPLIKFLKENNYSFHQASNGRKVTFLVKLSAADRQGNAVKKISMEER